MEFMKNLEDSIKKTWEPDLGWMTSVKSNYFEAKMPYLFYKFQTKCYLDKKKFSVKEIENQYVADIFVANGVYYVLTPEKLYYSNNKITWLEFSTIDVVGTYRQIVDFGDLLVMGTDEGIFYSQKSVPLWTQIDQDVPFTSILLNPDSLFTIADNEVWQGETINFWRNKGVFTPVISGVAKGRQGFIIATTSGLYRDGNSFYGENAGISLYNLKTNVEQSKEIQFNDVAANSITDNIIAGAADGSYWLYESGSWTENDSGLKTIQKVLMVDNDYWLFGNNSLKLHSASDPIIIGEGERL